MVSHLTVRLAALFLGFALLSSAEIPDGRWDQLNSSWHHEELWTRIVVAADGKGTDCQFLGELVLQNPSADFPALCRSRAIAVGGDTFDYKANGAKCYLKKCGLYADIRYTEKYGAYEVHTTLVGGWHRLTRAADGVGSDCQYLGSYALPDAASFPVACESRAAVLGGDTFDVKSDRSKCYFKRCGAAEDIKFTDKYGAQDTFSVLRRPFVQVVRAADGVLAACTSIADFAVPDPAADFPAACASKANSVGADTFDAPPDGSRCYLKKCGSLGDIEFSAAAGGRDVFTSLGGRWAQLIRSVDGVGTDCSYLGSLALSDPGDYPQACYSRALVLGGDTFDVKPDHSKCYFKRCGSFADVKFTDKRGGYDAHTVLSGGWSQITDVREGLSTDCQYLGSYEPVDTSNFPEACFSQAVIRGGDTFDAKVDGSKCYFKKCGAFPDIKFTAKYGARNSFTSLFPRGGEGWGPCDPATCLDLNLLYTSQVRGRFLPVGGAGETCDPEASEKCFGGTARRIAHFERMKEELESRNESVAIFDLGGSTFGGSLFSLPGYPIGRVGTILQNLIPYDFCLLSPRDFLTMDTDQARKELTESFGNRTCTFLLANADLNGLWKEFGATKVARWTVKRAPNGWKTAFIGVMPHVERFGYTYGQNAIGMDPHSLLANIRRGSFKVQASPALLNKELGLVAEDYAKLSAHFMDVVTLGSIVQVGVLAAMAEVRRTHPDVKTTVLLFGDNDRNDQVEWLARHLDVDIIMREDPTYTEPVLIQSVIAPKQVLVVGSETTFGVGHLKVRLHPQLGVERFDFKPDVSLDATVATNATVEAVMSEVYKGIRERNSRPYGNITNPLVGGHRGREAHPSMNQCYFMECNAGTVIGEALLWEARRRGYRADVSLYNLGGMRNTLIGDNGTVFISHCIETLNFQNTLKSFTILGKDLYENIKTMILVAERGFIGAGLRVAIHEPCFDYVKHEPDFLFGPGTGPPGTPEELQRCQTEGGVTDIDVRVIEMEVAHVDWDACGHQATCDQVQWRPLEKGTVYTMVATDYLQSSLVGLESTDISFSTDAEALCGYIAAHNPLEVESWEDHAQRGKKQYETAQDGWATGMRVTSVKTPISTIELEPTCPDGMHLPERGVACEPCPAGSQSVNDPARDKCQLCALGFFSERPKAAACLPCPAGHFANVSGSTSCFPCGPGTVSDTGAIYCNDCRPGQHAPMEASRDCLACPVGTFSAGTKSSSCTPCREGLVTEHPGTTSADQCLCPAGSYGAPAAPEQHQGDGPSSSNLAEATVVCLPCPRGMTCPFGSHVDGHNGTSLLPRLLPGYWSSAQRPLTVFRCRSQEKCVGGETGASCAPLLAGQACEHCVKGWYWAGGQGGHCAECQNSITIFPLIPLFLVPFAVCGLYFTSRDTMDKWNHWKNSLACQAFVVLNFLQTISLLGNVTVKTEGRLSEAWVVWTLTTDFAEGFVPNCVLLDSFEERTLTSALAPLIIVLISFLTMAGSVLVARQTGRDHWRMRFGGVHHVVGSLIFTFFSGIAARALMLFKCADNPNGSMTLSEDASITCYTSESWKNMMIVGILCVLVYCIGAGAAFVRAVLIAPRQNNFTNENFQWRWKFLFIKYRPEVYWFGILYLIRNFLLNLCFVVFSSGIVQVYALMIIIILYGALLVGYRPFRFCAAYAVDLTGSAISLLACAFTLRFGEDDGGFPVSTASTLAFVICFVPPALALLLEVPIVYVGFWRPVKMRSKCEEMLQKLKDSCSSFLIFSESGGVELLMEMGDWDHRAIQDFVNLIQSEILGKGGVRMCTGKAMEVYANSSARASGAIRVSAPRAFASIRTSIRHSLQGSQRRYSQGSAKLSCTSSRAFAAAAQGGGSRRLSSNGSMEESAGALGSDSRPLSAEGSVEGMAAQGSGASKAGEVEPVGGAPIVDTRGVKSMTI